MKFALRSFYKFSLYVSFFLSLFYSAYCVNPTVKRGEYVLELGVQQPVILKDFITQYRPGSKKVWEDNKNDRFYAENWVVSDINRWMNRNFSKDLSLGKINLLVATHLSGDVNGSSKIFAPKKMTGNVGRNVTISNRMDTVIEAARKKLVSRAKEFRQKSVSFMGDLTNKVNELLLACLKDVRELVSKNKKLTYSLPDFFDNTNFSLWLKEKLEQKEEFDKWEFRSTGSGNVYYIEPKPSGKQKLRIFNNEEEKGKILAAAKKFEKELKDKFDNLSKAIKEISDGFVIFNREQKIKDKYVEFVKSISELRKKFLAKIAGILNLDYEVSGESDVFGKLLSLSADYNTDTDSHDFGRVIDDSIKLNEEALPEQSSLEIASGTVERRSRGTVGGLVKIKNFVRGKLAKLSFVTLGTAALATLLFDLLGGTDRFL